MIKEDCGIFGIYSPNGKDAALQTYYGLFALQHRGQESAGIAVNCEREISLYKNIGLVHEVFDKPRLDAMIGGMAIGHVRYSTTGGTGVINAQPLLSRYKMGQLALAHNGNISNSAELTEELKNLGAIFQTTTDTEVIMHLLARFRLAAQNIESALSQCMKKLKGAYSLLVMRPNKLICCRDPKGMRPLCIGKRGNDIIFASETCALQLVGAEFVRDVRPGEIIVVENGEMSSLTDNCPTDISEARTCIFEYLYFARPDSVIDGMSVHSARKLTGKILSEEYPVEADMVIGVPDSGTDAAMGYAEASGIPFGMGLTVNRYVGRTFIKPSQDQRTAGVRLKMHVIRQAVAGKRVVMVDDSIVRGTTCANLVSMVRNAGATEIHMRISAPPFLYPCYFGTDIPGSDELIAHNHSVEEIRKMIGADSLGFMPVKRLSEIIPDSPCGCCDGCFTGKYPY